MAKGFKQEDLPAKHIHHKEDHAPADYGQQEQEAKNVPGMLPDLEGSLNSISTLCRLVEETQMPLAFLEQLARHPNSAVREALSDNPKLPYYLLFQLAADDSPDVRFAIAENHRTHFSVLSQLSEDDNPYVAARARQTIARLAAETGKNKKGKSRFKIKDLQLQKLALGFAYQ